VFKCWLVRTSSANAWSALTATATAAHQPAATTLAGVLRVVVDDPVIRRK